MAKVKNILLYSVIFLSSAAIARPEIPTAGPAQVAEATAENTAKLSAGTSNAPTPDSKVSTTKTTVKVTPDSKPTKRTEISIGAGFNWVSVDHTSIVVSPSETNTVRIRPYWNGGSSAFYRQRYNSALGKIGIGYHFLCGDLKKSALVNDLLVELNLYHTSATIRGFVWQFQQPSLTNYSFNAPVSSTRLMLDAKPILFTPNPFSIYPIFGVGASWNTVSYDEQIISSSVAANSNHLLGNQTNVNFAYDLGAGVRVDFTERLSASLEFLYANLGHMTPSNTSANGAPLISPPTFALRTESILLGLNYRIC